MQLYGLSRRVAKSQPIKPRDKRQPQLALDFLPIRVFVSVACEYSSRPNPQKSEPIKF